MVNTLFNNTGKTLISLQVHKVLIKKLKYNILFFSLETCSVSCDPYVMTAAWEPRGCKTNPSATCFTSVCSCSNLFAVVPEASRKKPRFDFISKSARDVLENVYWEANYRKRCFRNISRHYRKLEKLQDSKGPRQGPGTLCAQQFFCLKPMLNAKNAGYLKKHLLIVWVCCSFFLLFNSANSA